MVNYRRARIEGGSYFFTVALAQPGSNLLNDHAAHLGECFRMVRQRHPFVMDACVVMPDHLHCIWTLPEHDADYSLRWSLIKSAFSRKLAHTESRRSAQKSRGERGIWQRRFWEHVIRDEQDFRNHVDYIHINPVKHGYAERAIEWPYSSIHRFLKQGLCDPAWAAESFVLDMPLD